MSDVVSERPGASVSPEAPVIARLSFLDRLLPLWIILAMGAGIGLGRAIPSLNRHLNSIQVTSGTSLPIFIGLLVMMYPVLAKVRYDQLGSVTRDRRMLVGPWCSTGWSALLSCSRWPGCCSPICPPTGQG